MGVPFFVGSAMPAASFGSDEVEVAGGDQAGFLLELDRGDLDLGLGAAAVHVPVQLAVGLVVDKEVVAIERMVPEGDELRSILTLWSRVAPCLALMKFEMVLLVNTPSSKPSVSYFGPKS